MMETRKRGGGSRRRTKKASLAYVDRRELRTLIMAVLRFVIIVGALFQLKLSLTG